MKYLVIAALAVVVLILIYARLRPYLQLIRKVVKTLNQSSGSVAGTQVRTRAQDASRLVRCEGCGTWIPGERALKLSSGLTTYCSSECLEKSATSKGGHRAAG